ncbi:MAG: ACP S-malonyltransferase [Planctomycetota bacterium]
MTLVYLFPGQSSRYPGMLTKLTELHAPNLGVLAEAQRLLGRELDERRFERNEDIQIAVFLANLMFQSLLEARGVRADLSLGASLGELNHLVHIGALSFREALLTVQARGRAYDRGPRGWMAAVQPMEEGEVQALIERVRGDRCLEIANLNSPRQQVIAGHAEAVADAVRSAEDEHFAQPVVIEKRCPMHSSMFRPVADELAEHLHRVRWQRPHRPYFSNVLGRECLCPSPEQMQRLLTEHVHSPVQWRASIDHVRERWPDAVFVEVGAKSVLTSLMDRKWCRVDKHACDSKDETAQHLRELIPRLRAATSPRSVAS